LYSIFAISETSDDTSGTADRERKEEEQKPRKNRADRTFRNETDTENDDRKKRRTENTDDRRIQSRAQATASVSAAVYRDGKRKNREINDCYSKYDPKKSIADNYHTCDLKKRSNDADDE
jgi:hypothetical protein